MQSIKVALKYGALLALFLTVLWSNNLYATHLLGGTLAYKYLGDTDTNGLHEYELTLITYQDCNSQFWGNGFPNPSVQVSVYEGALFANNLPQVTSSFLQLTDSFLIQTNISDSCNFGFQNFCVFEVEYKGIVELPVTFQGYHFVHDVCCRGLPAQPPTNGNGPDNLDLQTFQNQGSIYHAWVGRTVVQNSSPIFADLTQPYLCLGDIATVNNNAVDLDGHDLTFEFIHPYDGNATSSAPFNGPFSYIPNKLVVYKPGFSFLQPFGATGTALIDPISGASIYQCNTVGIYLIAIRVVERLNGQIIGVSTREFQYFVPACNNLSAINLSSIQANDSLKYTVEEGESFCFDILFYDPNGDNLQLNITGTAFDSLLAPSATFTAPVNLLDSTVYSQICWNTSCGQGKQTPYTVVPSVIDNGCPPLESGSPYSIFVNPFEGPTTIQGITQVCKGPRFTYSVNNIAGATYNWTITNGTQVSGGNTHQIEVIWDNVSTNGNVSVITTSEFGCSEAAIDLLVVLKALPPIDAGTDTAICTYDSIQIGGKNPFPSIYTIHWLPDSTLSNDSIYNPFVKPLASNYYILRGTDADGCFLDDSVAVNLVTDNVTAGPDLYLCPGDSLQLNATGAQNYSWLPNQFLSAANVSNPKAFPSDTIIYALQGETIEGCIYHDTLLIEVDTIVPIHVLRNQIICLGDSLDIGGNPTAPPFTSVQWSPAFGLNSTSLFNPKTGITVDTTYFIQAFNGSCFGYDTVHVTVDTIPHVNAGINNLICFGDTINLLGTGDNLAFALWEGDTSIQNPTAFSTFAKPATSKWLKFTGKNSNGCGQTDSIFIIVSPLPDNNLPPDTFLCNSDSIQLTLTAGNQFNWFPNIGITNNTIANPIFFPDSTTTYQIQVVDVNNCESVDTIRINKFYSDIKSPNDTIICRGDTIQLQLSGGVTYLWNNNHAVSNQNVSNPFIFPVITTDFTVFISDANKCKIQENIRVEVSHRPLIFGPNNKWLCKNDSIRVLASGVVSFQWEPNTNISNTNLPNPLFYPDTTTTYFLTGIDQLGCKNFDTLNLRVRNLPNIDAGIDKQICGISTVSIGKTSNPNLVYEWNPKTGLNSPFAPISQATVNKRTQYVLTATDSVGCKNTDTVFVSVFEVVTLPDTLICSSDSLNLFAQAFYGNPPYYFEWSPATAVSDANTANPRLKNYGFTNFTVRVTDSTGCADTATFKLTVGEQPKAHFNLLTKPSCTEIVLIPENQSSPFTTPVWTFNGEKFYDEYPVFSTDFGNNVKLKLVVNSIEGCKDSLQLSEITKPLTDYLSKEMPNIFTPNGDGKNDFFEFPVENKLAACTRLEIYNRWGQLIFSSTQANAAWDGRNNDGVIQPEGTYFYVLKIAEIEWKGSVLLKQ